MLITGQHCVGTDQWIGLLPGQEGYNCWSWLIKSELELCLIFGTGSRIGARIYTVEKLDLELDSWFHLHVEPESELGSIFWRKK
jgi:hypothetical protein